MDWRRRYVYSAAAGEVEAFGEIEPVAGFLRKYKGDTRDQKARYLCMFFKWLSMVKDIKLGPDEFLRLLSEKRNGVVPGERLWGRNLALEFSRDNPDLKGKSVSYRYGGLFMAVKQFCDYNEVPLTTAKGVFGEKLRRKYAEPNCPISLVKKILAASNQRDRAICMVSLQSGQSIKQVLEDINIQYSHVRREIEAGKERVRFDFPERKGNNFPYYSFISKDAIQEIRKWLPIRKQWLEQAGLNESEFLFISRDGKSQLTPNMFNTPFRQKLQRHGLWTGPFSVRFHMFRKVFEQEASPPDRGISKAHVTFMMGHATDKFNGDRLDVVGGVYDNSPRVHDAVEREYEKFERYINIYSLQADSMPVLSKQQQRILEILDDPRVRNWLLGKMRQDGVAV